MSDFKLSEEHRAIIRRKYKNLRADFFDEFIAVAEAKGLNPLLKQIHADTRRSRIPNTDPPRYEDRLVIVTQIDGYRIIARRDGLAGRDASVFEDDDATGHPVKCSVTVYRWGPNGQKEAYTGTAYYAEYTTGKGNWVKLSHGMLAKCAEALALRMGFPECAGLYTDAELEKSALDAPPAESSTDVPEPEPPPEAAQPKTNGHSYPLKTERAASAQAPEESPDTEALKRQCSELFAKWVGPGRDWATLRAKVFGEDPQGPLDDDAARLEIIAFLEEDLARLEREGAIAAQDAAEQGASA